MNSKPLPLLARQRWPVAVFFAVVAWMAAELWAVPLALAQYDSFASQPARETGLRLGRGRLHGALGAKATYDSNALFSDQNQSSDIVMLFEPGADFEWDTPKVNVTTGYRFTLRDNLEQDIQDDKQHRANIDARYSLSRRISISVMDKFERSSEPADVELPERIGQQRNEMNAQVVYATPAKDLDFGLKYTNVWQKYDATLNSLSFFNNKVSVTSRINISSHFRFLPKSVLSMDIEYGMTDFNDPPVGVAGTSDSQGFSITGGLSSQFTKKLVIAAEIGATFIMFDNGPDTSAISGKVSSKFRLSPRIDLGLIYSRDVSVSTFTNSVEDQAIEFRGRWQFARRAEAEVSYKVDFLAFSDPNRLPSGELRKDTVSRAALNIGYDVLAWARAKVDYQMERRDSNAVDPITNAAAADFTKHSVTGGIELYY